MTKSFLSLFVLVFFASATLIAQHQITGKVIDETGEPIPGVNVIEKENNMNGTITNFDGVYTFEVGSNQSTLTFSFIGFRPQEVAIAGQNTINVTLMADVTGLDEVVVTALGIKREKKALGYAVQDVNSEDLNVSANPDVTSALQGKVAGVNITTSGGVGGNSRLDIRGTSSLLGDDNVLWVIDGVPFSGEERSNGGIWGGTSNGGGLLDINPENIENISVLKGGPAAALYGSRGANGVIMITTKDGSDSKGLNISYSGNVTVSDVAYVLETQNQYGQGTEGVYSSTASSAWGPKYDGELREAWNGEMLPYVGEGDKVKKFAQTGLSYNNSIAFANSNEEGNYRVSIGKNKSEGIFKGHEVDKLNFDLKAAYQINPWLKIDTKLSYIKNEGANRPEIGFYSYTSYLNAMPTNIRLNDLAPGYVIQDNKHVEYLYGSSSVITENPSANSRNPYFLQEQRVNNDERNRYFGYFAAHVNLMKDLSLRLKYGLDSYRYGSVWGTKYEDQISVTPTYNSREKFFEEENYEFLFSYNKDFNEDLNLGVTFGGNKLHRYTETMTANSGKLIGEDYFFLAGAENSNNMNVTESFEEKEIQSLYGSLDLGYKDMAYLTLTSRHDWSSSLPLGNYYFSYPSVSLSGIISEMVELPGWINYLKARASWAQVGKDPDAYFTDVDLSLGTGINGLTTLNIPNNIVDPNIKAELSTVIEFGVEFSSFNNRLKVEANYYNEQTENQIVTVENPQSAGYRYYKTNTGLILNKGIEALATITPIRTNDFNLGITLNFSKNIGEIDWLLTKEQGDEENAPFKFYSDNTQSVEVRGYEGKRLGDIYGTVYERNENGDIIVDSQGLPVIAQEKEKLGNIQADFTGSLGLNASYKGLFVNALFGMQFGGDIFSMTEASVTGSGNSMRTLDTGNGNEREDFYVDGVTETGASNTTLTSAQAYFGKVAGVDEEFMYDASYVKLREISVGYNIPKYMLDKIPGTFISSARFAIVGRDLFYLYKDTPGTVPDASAFSSTGNNGYGAQAFDFSPVPVTRSIGCSLNINF
ncbi:SusC/RagA family TonB-linked outer membrane protein [Saccharicrinis sp. 156]|uniref:SusC/RagA family TonB-linked outer membrane protein n=1 Tax=Saccharicrinis sp. 156 TaxID=3417574 RepID=UPI003D35900A